MAGSEFARGRGISAVCVPIAKSKRRCICCRRRFLFQQRFLKQSSVVSLILNRAFIEFVHFIAKDVDLILNHILTEAQKTQQINHTKCIESRLRTHKIDQELPIKFLRHFGRDKLGLRSQLFLLGPLGLFRRFEKRLIDFISLRIRKIENGRYAKVCEHNFRSVDSEASRWLQINDKFLQSHIGQLQIAVKDSDIV